MNHALMADILEESKNWLWDGIGTLNKEDHICVATIAAALQLYKTRPNTPDLYYRDYTTAAKEIRHWIWRATDGSHSAGAYLLSQGIKPTVQELQSYRLAWINQMIGVLRS